MAQRKYTLPRHTILAKQGARTGAFLVDLALTLVLTFVFVFGVFRPIFKKRVNGDLALIEKEQINSGLYLKNEEKGNAERISGKSEYTVFVDALEYFYFHYMPGVDLKEELEASKDPKTFTVEWFNENVLEIKENSEYDCFEYQKNGEEDDLTKIGVLKEDASIDITNKLVQTKYVDAIVNVFNDQSNVKEAGADYMLISTMQYVVSLFVSACLIYILVPWLFKDGQTFGKKVFKLGLANSDGYRFSSKRLIMRLVPFVVVDAALFLLIGVNLYIVLSIVLIMFLVSFALAMSSPKHMSLHDLTARTIVIDLKNSTLFSTVAEEEAYVLKEDNLLWEEDNQKSDEEGEEPEISYEK